MYRQWNWPSTLIDSKTGSRGPATCSTSERRCQPEESGDLLRALLPRRVFHAGGDIDGASPRCGDGGGEVAGIEPAGEQPGQHPASTGNQRPVEVDGIAAGQR